METYEKGRPALKVTVYEHTTLGDAQGNHQDKLALKDFGVQSRCTR